MKKIVLTKKELEDICGSFFDRGYYSGLYQADTTDKSIEIFLKAKKELLQYEK